MYAGLLENDAFTRRYVDVEFRKQARDSILPFVNLDRAITRTMILVLVDVRPIERDALLKGLDGSDDLE